MCPLLRVPSLSLVLPAGEALSGAPLLQSAEQRPASKVTVLARVVKWIIYIPLCRVKVSPRADAKKVEAKGIFPGAEVVRGPHWRFKDQDGEGGDMHVCWDRRVTV